MNTEIVVFEGIELLPVASAEHGYLMSTGEVAFGFAVTAEAIRQAKSRNADELIEGKHWVVTDCHTPGGTQRQTMWTKRGVIRLGFLITSVRAKQFRDFAEDLVLSEIEHPAVVAPAAILPTNFVEALRMLLASEEQKQLLSAEVARTEAVIEQITPAAQAWDQFLNSDHDYSVREAAQILDRDKSIHTGEGRLFAFLRGGAKWIDSNNEPYQRHINAGRIVRKADYARNRRTGWEGETWQVRITPKGLGELHKLLGGQQALNTLVWPELGLRVVGS